MRRNGYDSYRGRSRFRTVMKVLIGVLLVVLVLAVAALIWLEPYLGYSAGGIRINLPFFRREQPEDLRKEMDILSFCRIHEDKIIRSFKCFQDVRRISLDQSDLFLFPDAAEILPCHRDPLLVILDRCDPASGRDRLAHQQR